jgi:hypothetical protein
VAVLTGINDPQMSKGEVLKGDTHRFGDLGSLIELKLYTIALSLMEKKKIQFGTAISGPEIYLGRSHDLHELVEGKSFPGGADTWMPEKAVAINDIEQSVKNP